jgi:hypothetical protein
MKQFDACDAGAGVCLRPFLAELVSVLIESMSAIEPAELQYMQVQV